MNEPLELTPEAFETVRRQRNIAYIALIGMMLGSLLSLWDVLNSRKAVDRSALAVQRVVGRLDACTDELDACRNQLPPSPAEVGSSTVACR